MKHGCSACCAGAVCAACSAPASGSCWGALQGVGGGSEPVTFPHGNRRKGQGGRERDFQVSSSIFYFLYFYFLFYALIFQS